MRTATLLSVALVARFQGTQYHTELQGIYVNVTSFYRKETQIRVLILDDRSGNLLGADWELDLESQHRTEARRHSSQGTEWGMAC
jgi:hypothetical protein